MKKGKNSAVAHIVLYSLSSLLVGCAVGGTLLFKIMTQDQDPGSGSSVLPEFAVAAAPDTTMPETTETTETTTTTVVTLPPPDADSVRTLMKSGEELMTVTYSYTDSDSFENHSEVFGRQVPFTRSSVILTYSGTVTMSVEPDAIGYTVDNGTKQIYVILPEPKVISHEIDRDSVRCYDVQNSLFSSQTVNEYVSQLMRQKDSVLARVSEAQQMRSSILSQTEKVIRSMISASDVLSEYTVTFYEPNSDFVPQTQTTSAVTITEATVSTTVLPYYSGDDEDDNGGGWFFRW